MLLDDIIVLFVYFLVFPYVLLLTRANVRPEIKGEAKKMLMNDEDSGVAGEAEKMLMNNEDLAMVSETENMLMNDEDSAVADEAESMLMNDENSSVASEAFNDTTIKEQTVSETITGHTSAGTDVHLSESAETLFDRLPSDILFEIVFRFVPDDIHNILPLSKSVHSQLTNIINTVFENCPIFQKHMKSNKAERLKTYKFPSRLRLVRFWAPFTGLKTGSFEEGQLMMDARLCFQRLMSIWQPSPLMDQLILFFLECLAWQRPEMADFRFDLDFVDYVFSVAAFYRGIDFLSEMEDFFLNFQLRMNDLRNSGAYEKMRECDNDFENFWHLGPELEFWTSNVKTFYFFLVRLPEPVCPAGVKLIPLLSRFWGNIGPFFSFYDKPTFNQLAYSKLLPYLDTCLEEANLGHVAANCARLYTAREEFCWKLVALMMFFRNHLVAMLLLPGPITANNPFREFFQTQHQEYFAYEVMRSPEVDCENFAEVVDWSLLDSSDVRLYIKAWKVSVAHLFKCLCESAPHKAEQWIEFAVQFGSQEDFATLLESTNLPSAISTPLRQAIVDSNASEAGL